MKQIALLTLIVLVLVSQGLRLVAHVHARPTVAKRIAEETRPHIHLHDHDHHDHDHHDHDHQDHAHQDHAHHDDPDHDTVPCNPIGACPCPDHHSDALYISDVNLFRDAESVLVSQSEWSFGYLFVKQTLVDGRKRIVANDDPPSSPKCPIYLRTLSLRC